MFSMDDVEIVSGNIDSEDKYFNPICFEITEKKLNPINTPNKFKFEFLNNSTQEMQLNVRSFQAQIWQWKSYASVKLIQSSFDEENKWFKSKMLTMTNYQFASTLQDTMHNLNSLDTFLVFSNEIIVCYLIREKMVFAPCTCLSKDNWFCEIKFISTHPRLLSSVDNPKKKSHRIASILIQQVIETYKDRLSKQTNNDSMGKGLYVHPLSNHLFYKKFGFCFDDELEHDIGMNLRRILLKQPHHPLIEKLIDDLKNLFSALFLKLK